MPRSEARSAIIHSVGQASSFKSSCLGGILSLGRAGSAVLGLRGLEFRIAVLEPN